MTIMQWPQERKVWIGWGLSFLSIPLLMLGMFGLLAQMMVALGPAIAFGFVWVLLLGLVGAVVWAGVIAWCARSWKDLAISMGCGLVGTIVSPLFLGIIGVMNDHLAWAALLILWVLTAISYGIRRFVKKMLAADGGLTSVSGRES